MLTNQEPDWNIDALTDTEIYAAIHYLEPAPRNEHEQGPAIRIKILRRELRLFVHRNVGLLGLLVVLLETMCFSGKTENETH